MEQALGKCKLKQGSYMVMPCLHSCTPRSLCGRALEAALDPAVYLASPIVSLVKFGLMVNRTSYMQPLANMLETTYADPYDIQKKLFGLESYIKGENIDRKVFFDMQEKTENKIAQNETATGFSSDINNNSETISSFNQELLPLSDKVISEITPDIVLDGYKVQTPVIDSMKTALFEKPDVNKSMWNELSIWNRSFAKRIKTGTIEAFPNRAEYKFKYILQKEKNAPLVIIYPSIGENAGAHHSVIFAKIFYDAGYSVIMQGSHFHWEFVKSMPEGYAPGLPDKDSENVRLISSKIIDKIQKKYQIEPKERVVVGTSFGAMMTLFVADKESRENKLNIDKFIAISPPINLLYVMKQVDKNSKNTGSSNNVKDKTAETATKVLLLTEEKNNSKNFNKEELPFTDEEGKLITTFIMRQKLSDLIFTIENIPKNQKTDIYEMINNMSYSDYVEKYLGINTVNSSENEEKLASLLSLKEYLTTNNNYKIYHSLDDYFINKNQLSELKALAGNHLTCLNCGAHLGFLYRKEFEDELIKELNKKNNINTAY